MQRLKHRFNKWFIKWETRIIWTVLVVSLLTIGYLIKGG